MLSSEKKGWQSDQVAAAHTLGLLGDRRAIEPLTDAIRRSVRDSDHNVCLGDGSRFTSLGKAAATSLGRLGDDGLRILAQATQDSNVVLRETVLEGLAASPNLPRLGSQLVKLAVRDSDDRIRWRAASLLIACSFTISQPEVRFLVECLARSDGGSRSRKLQRKISGFKERFSAPSASATKLALTDRVAEVRQMAVHALCEIEDAEAREALIQVLKNEEEPLCGIAIAELGNRKCQEAVGLVCKHLQSTHRQIAVQAIEQIGDVRGVEPLGLALRRALETKPSSTSEKKLQDAFICAATDALVTLSDSRAIPVLIDVLNRREEGFSAGALDACLARTWPASWAPGAEFEEYTELERIASSVVSKRKAKQKDLKSESLRRLFPEFDWTQGSGYFITPYVGDADRELRFARQIFGVIVSWGDHMKLPERTAVVARQSRTKTISTVLFVAGSQQDAQDAMSKGLREDINKVCHVELEAASPAKIAAWLNSHSEEIFPVRFVGHNKNF